MFETAWLIERFDDQSRPMWWCGHKPMARHERIDATSIWSYDANDAIRFSRECDATKVARTLHAPSGIAREHAWCPLLAEQIHADPCSDSGHSLGGGCEKCVIGYYDSRSEDE